MTGRRSAGMKDCLQAVEALDAGAGRCAGGAKSDGKGEGVCRRGIW